MNDAPPHERGDDWFAFDELTERIAQLMWVEQQMFEILGLWSSVEAHSGAKILLATTSRHHGWHAQLLSECLATSAQLAEQATPAAPTEGWVAAVELLTGLDGPEQTAARLAAVVRELDPWLVRETTALLALARPVADAPLMRWLRFVEIDHHDDGSAMAKLLDAVQANTVSLHDRSLLAELDLRTHS